VLCVGLHSARVSESAAKARSSKTEVKKVRGYRCAHHKGIYVGLYFYQSLNSALDGLRCLFRVPTALATSLVKNGGNSGGYREEINLLPLSRIEPRLLKRPGHSLASTATELTRLRKKEKGG
jgi:hypothetical protein